MDLKSLLEDFRDNLLEMRVRFNNTRGKNLPDGSVIFGYKDSIWVIAPTSWKEKKEDIAADIRQKMGLKDDELKVKWAYSPEILVDFADTRSDVVVFRMSDKRLLYRRHTYGQSPQTSPLFRKVATYIKNNFGVPIVPFSMGFQMDTGSKREVDPSTFRGALPKEGWHGTNIDALSSIIKKGIMPQSSGNYGNVHTKGYIFFAADKSSLVDGYAIHSAGGMWSLETFPIIVHFKIPDQDKIKPDVDIANNLYGKKSAQINPDYNNLTFTNKKTNTTKGKKNSERMWKHSELFGYKGRIPPSHILSFTSYEKLGGENISRKQMIENIKAWEILKTKFEPKQIISSNVSWVSKSAKKIVSDVINDIEIKQKNEVKESKMDIKSLLEAYKQGIVEKKLEKDSDDPCWDGYVQLGTKKKGGKEVPNCVPKESVEIDEAKTDVYHKYMLKALGKSKLPKNHSFTSAIADNGDFVVRDGGGRIVGRIPKGEHGLKESTELTEDVHNDLHDAIIMFQRKLMKMTSKLDPAIAKEVKKIDKDLDDLRTGPLFKIRPGR